MANGVRLLEAPAGRGRRPQLLAHKEAAMAKELTLEAAERIIAACKKKACLLYTSPSPRDRQKSRMPSSA